MLSFESSRFILDRGGPLLNVFFIYDSLYYGDLALYPADTAEPDPILSLLFQVCFISMALHQIAQIHPITKIDVANCRRAVHRCIFETVAS